jgi:hypothetical protein
MRQASLPLDSNLTVGVTFIDQELPVHSRSVSKLDLIGCEPDCVFLTSCFAVVSRLLL